MFKSLPRFRSFTGSVSRFLCTSSKAELEVEEAFPHVFHVRLNRPDRRNTFTVDLWKELRSVFDGLAENPKCRAIVLSGNGKSFCAGIDLQQGMGKLIGMLVDEDLEVGRKGRMLRRFITTCQDSFTAIEACSKPVIAAIHSHCIGAGVDLITACDIRYASSDALFSIREVDIGMTADVGTLNRIQKVVSNDSWVRELAFTARDIGADEALKFGLISRVFDCETEVIDGALALAKTIAEKSPIGVQGTKEVLNHARDHTIRDSLDFVKTWNMSQLQSEDLRIGAVAAMNKQKPEFQDV